MMDVRLQNKTIYRDDSGRYEYIYGLDELVQRVQIACTVPLGSFVYNRSLGIDLSDITPERETLRDRLDMRVREACVNITPAQVEVVSVNTSGHDVTAVIRVSGSDGTRTTEVTYSGIL